MEPADNLHSQIVGWAKIILPLSALALLSTLFLFAFDRAAPDEIALAEINEIAREQRLNAPEFSGLTDDGAVVVIAARSAQPDGTRPDTVTINGIRMRMDTPTGVKINAMAVQGEVDGRARVARFLGLASVETSDGYMLETNGLIAELDSGTITSDGLLEVRAPFGEITAGNVLFRLGPDATGREMVFTNGVRLLYSPQTP